ncbi:hypothetical protein GCM10011506_47190 [Marivirga lumbricoides]|uniref:Uncharacterized protein n=1 Tax=Marivirga lumbricoides TaxID=1046115 RepID=A0ABQ1N6Y1_9BACT|nr:hypothetical protein GCM10011506_47190 [Marivirga lumbricoides]
MFKLNEIIKDTLAEIQQEFSGSDKEFNTLIKEKSPELLKRTAKVFMSGLCQFYEGKRINEIQDSYAQFLKWNEEIHGDGLEMFLMYIDLTVTVNNDMTDHFKMDKFSEDEKLKFSQLLHLHIKGCQIANEIYALIKCGYADAALARWRTLHETSVVFLTLFTNDLEVSKMFYEYQFIEKLKRLETYEIHHATLNWRPSDGDTVKMLQKKRDELHDLYGAGFLKEYGWTIKFLSNRKRNFKGLEEKVGLDYLRPFYQWANKGVHAGPEGLFTRLGFNDINIPRGYLAGPSRYGMLNPMQFTTYSLLKMTTGLTKLTSTFESKLVQLMLEQLHAAIAEAMIEAKAKLPNN